MPPPFAAVFFDCDSTLSTIEGVDELLQGAHAGLREQVAALTEAAMDGTLPIADVYERRLALLSPARDAVERLGPLYVRHLVPDAVETIAALQHVKKRVGIVSGGLAPGIRHVAAHLGVPAAHTFAVGIAFDAAGRYASFDRSSPLWRNGGKVEVLAGLPDEYRPLAFVGDGATDLETQGHVARFVGFGGVVARPLLRERAEVFVEAKSLAAILPHVLTGDERRVLAASPRFAPLLSPHGA